MTAGQRDAMCQDFHRSMIAWGVDEKTAALLTRLWRARRFPAPP